MKYLSTPMCRINGMSACPAELEEDTDGWTVTAYCTKGSADMLRPGIGQEPVRIVLMSGEWRERRQFGYALTGKIVYDGDPKYPDWPCVVTLTGSTPLTDI